MMKVLHVSPLAVLATLMSALTILPPALAQQKSNFTIGIATGTQLSSCPSDPGGVNGTCWGLNISCPNVSSFLPYDVTVKVTSPMGLSNGVIIFIAGGGGTPFYDSEFTYGTQIINTILNANFTVAQIAFDNPVAGWLTGPALDGEGPISLACLPATAIQWIYNNRAPGAPLCATGNSGGSAAIVYALAHYGAGPMLSMAELTSGPVFSRLDHGCSPTAKYVACATCGSGTQAESYGLTNAENFVDPAYDGVVNRKPTGICSKGIQGSNANVTLLHHDSILSDTFPPSLSYATDIHMAFGGQDLSGGAIPEGIEWAALVTTELSIVCVPSAGHDLASYLPGATQIESDLIKYCKLQP